MSERVVEDVRILAQATAHSRKRLNAIEVSVSFHSVMTSRSSGRASGHWLGPCRISQAGEVSVRSAAGCSAPPMSICSRQSCLPSVSSPPSRVYPRKCGLRTFSIASFSQSAARRTRGRRRGGGAAVRREFRGRPGRRIRPRGCLAELSAELLGGVGGSAQATDRALAAT